MCLCPKYNPGDAGKLSIYGSHFQACFSLFSKVSKGAKFSEGLSWSQQLADKVEPIATHISWSVRNCDENPQKLKESLVILLCAHSP
jgi:hypothetical protein